MKKIAIIVFFLNSYIIANSIEETLKTIPIKDRKYLECFFRDFVNTSNLAFIFFNEKPIALTSYILYAPPNCYYAKNANIQSLRGWEKWKKYEHLFPHPNFIFIEEIRNEGVVKVKNIFFINKISLLHLLKQHEQRFIEKLGNSFSPENFINSIEETKTLFSLINDDELLGIMLGFGAESSRNYIECHDKLIGFDSSGGKNYEINGVVFMGHPNSKEAYELMNKYHHQQEQLCQMYRKKNFLKTTLSLLSQANCK